MVLVGFGIALPLFNLLMINRENAAFLSNIFDCYNILLYSVSMAFIFLISYVCLSQDNGATQNSTANRIYFGSSILRISGILFGIITVIHSCLDVYDVHTESWYTLRVMVPLFRVLLVLSQIAFIFNTETKIIPRIRAWTKISSFGLMHIVATNVCEWISIIITETHDYIIPSNGVDSSKDFKENIDFFLFPVSVEYFLMCALVAYEIWKKVNSTIHNSDHDHTFEPSVTNYNVLPRSSWALIVTVVQLSAAIIVVTIFYAEESMLFVDVYSGSITCMAIVVLSYIMFTSRKMEKNDHLNDNPDERQKIELDSKLLLTSLFGAFLLSIFNVIVQLLQLVNNYKTDETKKTYYVGELALEIITIVERCIQTLLILNLYWKKSGQNHITMDIIKLLLVSNFSMWLINAFVGKTMYHDRNHNDVLPNNAWIIITHMTLPSQIFFRFHSMVCYFEILKNVFATHIL